MAKTELAAYVDRPYRIVVYPERYSDGRICYIAEHPKLPGCMSDGDTPEEAVASLREARELYIQALLEHGVAVPDPQPEEEAGGAVRDADLAEENRRLKARVAELERALALR